MCLDLTERVPQPLGLEENSLLFEVKYTQRCPTLEGSTATGVKQPGLLRAGKRSKCSSTVPSCA